MSSSERVYFAQFQTSDLPPPPSPNPTTVTAETFQVILNRTNYSSVYPFYEDVAVWVDVKNTGEVTDEIRFHVLTENIENWTVHGGGYIYLEPGEVGSHKLLAANPSGAEKGEQCAINIQAESVYHGTTATFTVNVLMVGDAWENLPLSSKIYGKVYDNQTKGPIPGATIKLELWSGYNALFLMSGGLQENIITGADGSYEINVRPYEPITEIYEQYGIPTPVGYIMQVDASGYKSYFKAELKPPDNGSMQRDIYLDRSATASYQLAWENILEYPGVWKCAASENWGSIAVALGKHPDPGETFDPAKAYLFNSDGALLWENTLEGPAWGVDITRDGSLIAFGTYSADGYTYVFDRAGSLFWENGGKGEIESVKFSNNGAYLATGPTENGSGVFGLFSSTTGELLWENDVAIVKAVAFSDDDNFVAVAGGNAIWLFDINGGLLWRRYIAGKPYFIKMSPGLSHILVADKGGCVSVYDKDGNLRWRREIADITYGSMNRDGSRVVILDIGGMVHYFDGDGNLLWRRNFVEGIGHNAVEMTDDGRYVVVGGQHYWTALLDEGGTVLWRYQAPGLVPENVHGYDVSTMYVDISDDGSRILSGYGASDPRIHLFEGTISEPQPAGEELPAGEGVNLLLIVGLIGAIVVALIIVIKLRLK